MKLLVLAGPTAAGKSESAMAVARRYGALLLSADAMQVYRGMDIGTATPNPQERAEVPHRCINVVDPTEAFSAADFLAHADRALAEGRPVVAVGGSSLYLRALVRGLALTPPVDPALRAELESQDDLHAQLARVDPELAARLHPNDRLRLVRGLEVFLTSGRPLSQLQAEHAAQPDRLHHVGLWLDRDDLYTRIDARVGHMVERGYVAEVRDLLAAGTPRQAKPMQSLGYRHIADHLLDDLPLDEALRRTQRDTRRFARKQRNWRRQLGYDEVRQGHVAASLLAAQAAFGPVG